MELPSKLQKLFVHNKWTLSLAESCTGGAIAAQIVQVPDSSFYFLGGVVAYSNAAKEELLGVLPQTLEEYGAVSEEVAREMAWGALNRFGSTYALATTGIAGPSGGSEGKPVGLVAFAVAGPDEQIIAWTSRFHGERRVIIEQATQNALAHLLQTNS